MQALRYAVEEAIASLRRGRQSGLLSTATIALALFVLGAFLLVTTNLRRLADDWSRNAQLSVYLTDDASPADRAAIESALAVGSVVVDREYVSRADALVRFKRTFGDLAAAVDDLGENPLPESYDVRLRSEEASGSAVERLATSVRQMHGVADVRYDREWIDRLLAAVSVVRGVGFALAGILTIAAALTVANVVRLGLFARRDELEIMNLVGAPAAYVRGPFIVEGILQGGVGALAALAALGAAFWLVRSRYLAAIAPVMDVSAIRFLPAGAAAILVIGGMAVGCAGGFIAARNGMLTES